MSTHLFCRKVRATCLIITTEGRSAVFQKHIIFSYIFPRKYIIYTGHICTEAFPKGSVQRSMLLSNARAAISSTKKWGAVTVSSLPALLRSALKICLTYHPTSNKSAFCKHAEFFPSRTSRRCSSTHGDVVVLLKVPARVRGSSSLASANLDNKSFIHATDCCAGLFSFIFPKPFIDPLKFRLSGRHSEYSSLLLSITDCSYSSSGDPYSFCDQGASLNNGLDQLS